MGTMTTIAAGGWGDDTNWDDGYGGGHTPYPSDDAIVKHAMIVDTQSWGWHIYVGTTSDAVNASIIIQGNGQRLFITDGGNITIGQYAGLNPTYLMTLGTTGGNGYILNWDYPTPPVTPWYLALEHKAGLDLNRIINLDHITTNGTNQMAFGNTTTKMFMRRNLPDGPFFQLSTPLTRDDVLVKHEVPGRPTALTHWSHGRAGTITLSGYTYWSYGHSFSEYMRVMRAGGQKVIYSDEEKNLIGPAIIQSFLPQPAAGKLWMPFKLGLVEVH